MAIVRTILPRKGIIQPKHGDNYETDLDSNWTLIDSLLQDGTDVQAAVLAAGTVEAWLSETTSCGSSEPLAMFCDAFSSVLVAFFRPPSAFAVMLLVLTAPTGAQPSPCA